MRSAPRVIIRLRLFALAMGLIFVLSTTDTIQAFQAGLKALSAVGEMIQKISGTSPAAPTLKKQEDKNG